jgi:hypothetical protein
MLGLLLKFPVQNEIQENAQQLYHFQLPINSNAILNCIVLPRFFVIYCRCRGWGTIAPGELQNKVFGVRITTKSIY